jgi:histidinol-phosphate aminotransferase
VLARFGGRSARVCHDMAARGIYLRDRSTSHGCDGCVRITTGVAAHTERCIEALEEVLCAAR